MQHLTFPSSQVDFSRPRSTNYEDGDHHWHGNLLAHNTSLSDCASVAICKHLADFRPSDIYRNAEGCRRSEEIIIQCRDSLPCDNQQIVRYIDFDEWSGETLPDAINGVIDSLALGDQTYVSIEKTELTNSPALRLNAMLPFQQNNGRLIPHIDVTLPEEVTEHDYINLSFDYCFEGDSLDIFQGRGLIQFDEKELWNSGIISFSNYVPCSDPTTVSICDIPTSTIGSGTDIRFAAVPIYSVLHGSIRFSWIIDNIEVSTSAPTHTVLPTPTDTNHPVYPNPTEGRLWIADLAGPYEYQVFALDGRLITSGGATGSIDISTLATGTYILAISSEDHNVRHKVVKL